MIATSSDSEECALWYMRHGVANVELHPTEQHAVNKAISMQECETAAPDGVQFPDGTYYDADEWPALKAEQRRRYDELLRSLAEAPQSRRPILVKVVSPAGRRAEIEEDDLRPWLRRG